MEKKYIRNSFKRVRKLRILIQSCIRFFYLFLKFHDFFSVKAMSYIKGQTFIISLVCTSYGIQNQVNILVFVMQVT